MRVSIVIHDWVEISPECTQNKTHTQHLQEEQMSTTGRISSFIRYYAYIKPQRASYATQIYILQTTSLQVNT